MKSVSRHSPASVLCDLLCASLFFFSIVASQGGNLETIGVSLLRQLDPTLQGNGIRVTQAEAVDGGSPGTNAFEVNPFAVAQPVSLFTWISDAGTATTYPNTAGSDSGHAHAVALNFFDLNSGVAPQVAHVDNYEANYFINNIVVASAPAADRIINQSFTAGTYDTALDQFYDDYAAGFNVLFLTGAERNNFPVASPATAYNGIGVGVFDTATPPFGPTPDGRSKPDITSPGSGATSFSTPYVAGSATLLMQAADRGDGGIDTNAAADIRTIKALLLNGAVKPSNWTNGPTTPLDARFGAGIVNVFNSWEQMRGGQRTFVESTIVATNAAHPPGVNTNNEPVLAGWDFNSITNLSSQDKINHYYFNVAGSNSSTLTTTLVWNRQSGQTAINDLNLFLYNTANSNLVAVSTSRVDNVEHLFLPQLAPGRYDLQVLKRGSGQVSTNETYALAFEMFNLPLKISLSNNLVLVSWPLAPTGFQLQSTTNLNPPAAWTPVAAPVTVDTNTSQNIVSIPATGAAQYFRLQRP